MGKFNNAKPKQTAKLNKNKPVSTFDLKSLSIQELHDEAVKCYQANEHTGEDRWNKMLTQTGTKKDKIAAAANLILQHPESSLKYFDMMTKWCFDTNHNFAILACESLSNLYMDHIFGDKKSLAPFADSVQDHIHNNRKKTEVEATQLMGFYLES